MEPLDETKPKGRPAIPNRKKVLLQIDESLLAYYTDQASVEGYTSRNQYLCDCLQAHKDKKASL